MNFNDLKVTVPEGRRGDWAVERFTISEKEARLSVLSFGGRTPDPGTYTRLMRGGTVVMSDTRAELWDISSIVYKAKGHVLINGLGLGVVLSGCLNKPEVTQVTVVEKSADVIALVGVHVAHDPRVEIVHGDAFEYQPPKGVRYACVWHDIWDGICSDNLKEMKRLHRKYGRRADWQGSWCRAECEYARGRGR